MPPPKPFVRGAKVASVGLELGVSVLIGAVLGMYLDKKLHTGPWLGIAGLVFGIMAGGLLFYRAAQKAMRRIDAKGPEPSSDEGEGDHRDAGE